MNIIRKSILAALAVVAICPLSAKATIDNPITQAVIRVYNEQIALNPKDYETLFSRAFEYYNHNEPQLALADVSDALKYAPAGNWDFRFQAYMLRSSIYSDLGNDVLALNDLNSAIALDNSAYTAYNQRGNAYLKLGDCESARKDFIRMQRFNPRSPEAFIGLARCEVLLNNKAAAEDYMRQAVECAPKNSDVYVRCASIRREFGDNLGAINDLVMAIRLNPNSSKPVQALAEFGNTDYAATIAGLTTAVNAAPNNGIYRFLRASIAEAHYNYLAAMEDYQAIIDAKLLEFDGIYYSLACCQFGLGKYEAALDNIESAVGMAENVAEYYVTRSKILRALGKYDLAVLSAQTALEVDREYVPAYIEEALGYVAKKDYNKAASLLGEVSMINANLPEVYMLRAWVLENFMNQPVAAKQFREQALMVEGYEDTDINSLRGFALLKLGRTAEADKWIENILENVADPDGIINYYATCYYVMRGDDDKALEYAENSLKAGYSDNHNWMNNTDGDINVGHLRDDLRFLRLMQSYNSIFGK